MKKLFYILYAVFSFRGAIAQNSFVDFLTARNLLYIYESEYNSNQIPEIKPYLKYKNVDLGFNNYKKYILLLKYYFKTKQFPLIKIELPLYIQNGLYLDSIPAEVRADKDLFNISMYEGNRNIYLNKMNTDVLQRMRQASNDDQRYRWNQDDERQSVLDSINFLALKDIEQKYGWAALLESNYDLYNNYDSTRINWEVFPLIGHFERNKIIYFRNIAIREALKGTVGWDEVVLLEQYLLSRNPEFLNVTPLEFITLKPDGKINMDASFIELFTLGQVLMRGRKGMKIEIFPTLKMESTFKSQIQPALAKMKNLLMSFHLEERAIKTNAEALYPGQRLNNYYFVYRITEYKGGFMNWFPPYFYCHGNPLKTMFACFFNNLGLYLS